MSQNEEINDREEQFEEVRQSKFNLVNYYEQNSRSITIAAIALIVVVAGVWAYFKWYQPKQLAKQNAELFMTERYFQLDSIDLVLNGDGMNPSAVELAGGGNVAARKASYMAGRALMDKGQFEEAIPYLKDANFDDMMVGPLAKCLLGDCYAELERYDEAAKAYMKAADKNKNDFTTPYALRKAARAFEKSGDWAKASNAYKRIKAEYPDTEFAQYIEKYIARAEAKAANS